MIEKRLTELETKLAYQEDSLQVLSDEIARQQKQIDRLHAICQHLLERAGNAPEGSAPGIAADEVPPHY